MPDWVTWHGAVWAFLVAALLGFEIYTLIWNQRHKGSGKRANLTAYVRALFGVGDRRLPIVWPTWILAAVMIWLTFHFLGIIK